MNRPCSITGNWITENGVLLRRTTVRTTGLTVVIFGDEVGIRHIVLKSSQRNAQGASEPVSSVHKVLSVKSVPGSVVGRSTCSSAADRNLHHAAQELGRYLSGKPVVWGFRFAPLGGTDWEHRVWGILQEIPFGQVRTYGWLARRLGNPGASRAVGRALGNNPLPIVVPCHRIVAADGSLGGFSSGTDVKRLLLDLEGSFASSDRTR